MNKCINLLFYMENIDLINKIANLESVIIDLKDEIKQMKIHFESELKYVKEKRTEIYYQNFLEKYIKVSHKNTKFGTTDISTENCHIKIKHWKHFKAALGELLSYNHDDNKELAAYFYGDISDEQKNNIIQLYRDKNVSICEFIDSLDGIQINEVLNINKELENNVQEYDFYQWLNNKIVFSENHNMSLEEICSSFLKKKNVHLSVKFKYRIIIEKFIKENFKENDVEWKYGPILKINEKIFKGWVNLIFVDNNDHFIKF